jgi:epoxyqueuosine reductase
MNAETQPINQMKPEQLHALAGRIRAWGRELGFQQTGISDIELETAEQHLQDWLAKGFHGSMDYMERHGTKRSRPQELVTGTRRVISVRMDYLPEPSGHAVRVLRNKNLAYISRYALGRDYHKVMRSKLKKLVTRIENEITGFNYRVFTDSAPVLEKALAEKAGLGWIGKHSNLIARNAGSWFFLGEIYTDLPLPVDDAAEEHCGSCRACMDICPTRAIVAPYQVDARLCISYLTIENRGTIAEHLRPMLGNRIYGCDDCQLCCPWNRFARLSAESDYHARNDLDSPALLELLRWSEQEFLEKTEGSAIRRIGYQGWLRNIAVALGNADFEPGIIEALEKKLPFGGEMAAEHLHWAIVQQQRKSGKTR